MKILEAIAPFFRIAILGGIALAVAFTNLEKDPSLRGLVFGALMADYLTWLFRTFVLFPFAFWRSAADAVTNVAFAVFVLWIADFRVDPNDPSFGFAAFGFIVVGFVKSVIYLCQFFDNFE